MVPRTIPLTSILQLLFIVLTTQVKVPKMLIENFTLAQSVNKFHYEIYTYWSVSAKPFTHTTLVYIKPKNTHIIMTIEP